MICNQLNDAFNQEIKDVVNCIHGNNSIDHRFGKAYGLYTVDVSPWLMSYIIGREIHPAEIQETNSKHSDQTSFSGTAFKLASASPSEVWAVSHLDELVRYERNNYNTERPVSISSWPTLDPLAHPTETTSEDGSSIDLANLNINGAPAGFFRKLSCLPILSEFY